MGQDLGAVGGLGDVITKPTAGWTTTLSAQPGHGYVVRYRHAHDYNAATELPYYYARVYVDSYITNVFGEIIGVKIKYQLPF